jgi:WD40 repeat protein
MNSNDAELLLAYLAGDLTGADTAALEARLKTEPHLAEQLVTLARDESILAEWAKLNAVPAETPSQPLRPSLTPSRPMRRRLYVGAAILTLAAGLIITVNLLNRGQPVVPPAGPVAVLEDTGGEVVLVSEDELIPVVKGHPLFGGAELRTIGEGSFAVVRYPDAARLELSADTTARLENDPANTKRDARRVWVSEGLLTAEVTRTPMLLATPHAEVYAGFGTFVCNIATGSTSIEPEKGRVEVTRRGKDKVEVKEGYYAVANQTSVSNPRQRPNPIITPLATLSDGVVSPCLAWTPDGRTLIAGGADGNVRFWNTETRELGLTIKAHTNAVRCLAISPDGRTLVTAGQDRFLRIWDTATGEERYTIRRQRGEIEGVGFSPDSRTFAAAFGPTKDGVEVRLWDTETGLECGAVRTIAKAGVNAIAFSADGRTLATGGKDGVVRLWDVEEDPSWSTLRGPGQERFTFHERQTFRAHSQEVRAVVVSPNGRLLATAGREGTACVWQVSGDLVYAMTEHGREVRSVAISHDGALLATTGSDGVARLWHTADGQPYANFRANKHGVLRAVFSPDGKTLATTGADRSIKLWKLQAPFPAAGL